MTSVNLHRYIAVRDCIYNGELYKAGKHLEQDSAPVACPACTGGTPEGVTCRLCRGSKRISPPHHFELLEGKSNAEEKEIPEGHEKVYTGEKKEALLEVERAAFEESERLKAEITRLGGSYIWNCGVEKLRMQLQKLQKEVGERNVAPPPIYVH